MTPAKLNKAGTPMTPVSRNHAQVATATSRSQKSNTSHHGLISRIRLLFAARRRPDAYSPVALAKASSWCGHRDPTSSQQRHPSIQGPRLSVRHRTDGLCLIPRNVMSSTTGFARAGTMRQSAPGCARRGLSATRACAGDAEPATAVHFRTGHAGGRLHRTAWNGERRTSMAAALSGDGSRSRV